MAWLGASNRSITSRPGAISLLTATPNGTSQILLSWSPAIGATTYTVTRLGGPSFPGIAGTTFNDTGLASSTTYTYTVQGVNSAGLGLASPPASATTHAASGNAVKLHAVSEGGFYAYTDNGSYAGSISSLTSYLQRSDIANMAGVQCYFRISEMEVSQGNYTQLFTDVDNLVALCRAAGKRLAFGAWERGFGTSDGTAGGMSPPSYMNGGTHCACPNTSPTPAGSNSYTCWAVGCGSFGGVNSLLNYGSQTCLNDIIAMYQALGDRYNSNPTVECFIWFGETAFSPGSTSPSAAAFNTAILQIANAIAPHWQNTLIRLETNFVPGGSNTNMVGWLGLCDTLPQFVPGGPDPVTTPPLTGFNTTANSDFTGNNSGPDRRGISPWWSEVQTNGMGGANKLFPGGSGTGAALGASTAKAMIDAQIQAGAYYFTVNFTDNTDTVQFNRDMLPYINSLNGKLQSVVPSSGTWNES